jgi:enoyl-CoA hydratase/carnithine racemase
MTTPIEIPPPSPNDVLYEKREGYAVITFNRPVVLNAVNWSILRRLRHALDQAIADDDVRAVILTGAGRAFCAGGDLQSTPPDDDEPTPGAMEICRDIWSMPKPVIAAVNGYAVGQGCEWAGICDITIAAEDAKFGEIQIRHGFGPPILITPFLVGLKQAKELMLSGDMIDAEQAMRLGLVNRVVPADRLMEEAEGLARKIAALKPNAVRTNKLLINRVYELAGFDQALNYREDPRFGGGPRGPEPDKHLDVLREKGWEAFRESRDVLYRQSGAGSRESAGTGED